VAARTSSFSLKGKDLQISEVGEILKVAHVLEGSVRKAGNQVRITAQLINAKDGYHLWSDTYDRSLDNIFAIQDEIANEVVAQMKVTLLGDAPSVRETDPEAYALFLQGRHIANSGNPGQLTQAIALFEQVTEIDPGYAEAWSELGRALRNQGNYGQIPQQEAIALGRKAQTKALDIDPGNAVALSRLGSVESGAGNLDKAAHYLQLALELEPGNSAVLGNAANLAEKLGRGELAIRLATKSTILDPANGAAHLALAYLFYNAERTDEAMSTAQTMERLNPDGWYIPYLKGSLSLLNQDYESAYTAYEREGDPGYRAKGMAMAAYSLGRTVEFEKTFDEMKQGLGQQFPSEIAAVHIYTGDFDAAFEWLEKAAESGDSYLYLQIYDPLLAGIHKDARWSPFLESIGRSPEQLDAIEFKVTLPE
jgi:tetratricopeptide (TPR) repeat protein